MNVSLNNSIGNDVEWGIPSVAGSADHLEEGVRTAALDPLKNSFKYAWDGILDIAGEDSDEEGEDKKAGAVEGGKPKESKAEKKARKKAVKAAKAGADSEQKIEKKEKDETSLEKKARKKKTTEKKVKKADKADEIKESKKEKKEKKKAKESVLADVIEPKVKSDVEAIEVVEELALVADEAPKAKGKDREEFGGKHYAALTAAFAFTTGMAILYKESPFLAFAFTGAWMDFIRVAYKSLPKKGWQINSFRVAAVASAIISIITVNFTPKDSIYNAIPFFNLAAGILIKGEWKNIDPANLLKIQTANIGEKMTGIGFTANGINVGTSIGMIASSIPLTMPTLPSAFQITGATVLKMNLRKGVNAWFQQVKVCDSSTFRKISLTAMFSMLAATGGLSYYILEKDLAPNPLLKACLTGVNLLSLDTFARIGKNGLWRFAKQLKREYTPEKNPIKEGALLDAKVDHNQLVETLLKLSEQLPLGFLLLAIVAGVATPLDSYFLSKDLPLAVKAIVAQELATLLKPISKEWVGTSNSLVFELMGMAFLMFSPYHNDFALAMMADNVVFCLKDKVRPKKLSEINVVT